MLRYKKIDVPIYGKLEVSHAKIWSNFKNFESRGYIAKSLSRHLQLSRFEKGQTDLTITKFMLILDEINMPIDEFMYAVHDFHRDELNELLAKIQFFCINS